MDKKDFPETGYCLYDNQLHLYLDTLFTTLVTNVNKYICWNNKTYWFVNTISKRPLYDIDKLKADTVFGDWCNRKSAISFPSNGCCLFDENIFRYLNSKKDYRQIKRTGKYLYWSDDSFWRSDCIRNFMLYSVDKLKALEEVQPFCITIDFSAFSDFPEKGFCSYNTIIDTYLKSNKSLISKSKGEADNRKGRYLQWDKEKYQYTDNVLNTCTFYKLVLLLQLNAIKSMTNFEDFPNIEPVDKPCPDYYDRCIKNIPPQPNTYVLNDYDKHIGIPSLIARDTKPNYVNNTYIYNVARHLDAINKATGTLPLDLNSNINNKDKKENYGNLQRIKRENSRGTITGTIIMGYSRQQITTGSRCKGNRTTTSYRRSSINSVKIKKHVIYSGYNIPNGCD